MSITIHIRLLSGDVIDCRVRARAGQAKLTTVRKTLTEKVLEEMKLEHSEWKVTFVHDDDEEKRNAILQQRWDSANRQYRRPARPMDPDFKGDPILIQHALDKQRVYHDGDVVHAVVEEFNIRRMWYELADD